jgi:hypothetical protein
MDQKNKDQSLEKRLWEDFTPIELVQSIDESLLSMVLLLRYESSGLPEMLTSYENLHRMRALILDQLPEGYGNQRD